MAAISFYVRDLNNGTMQIICKVSHGTNTPTRSLGYTIPSDKTADGYKHWDNTKYRAKNCANDTVINERIAKWSAQFNSYLKDCEHYNHPFNARALIKMLGQDMPAHATRSSPLYLSDLAQMFVHYITKRKDSPTNIGAYKVIQNQVLAYEKKYGNVMLHEVGEEFYKNFGNYLIAEELNTNNSVRRKITRIVTIMNYAYKNKLVKDKTYEEKPNFKATPSKKISLLPDEITALEKFKPASKTLQLIKDAFLVACYTGLRFSDIIQLKPIHIMQLPAANKSIDVISLTQFKGTKANTIPLPEKAKKLLIYHQPQNTRQVYFNFTHGQQISRNLKTIFKDAKLNRICETVTGTGSKITKQLIPLHDLISFHMGRNTYITSLLAAGMPAVFVKDNAGHSDIRTTMGYSKQDDYNRFQQTLAIQNKKRK